jgi:hypothetical protein
MASSNNRSCSIRCIHIIKGLLLIALVVILTILNGTVSPAATEKNEHLFFIERSKNRNIVYYDVCHNGDNTLCESNPVTAYWILDGGKREGLSSMEKEHAFGIRSLDMSGHNARFSIAALAKNTISVEKINGRYRASTFINNREIYLEKVYVNTKEGLLGLPTVRYVEYTGRTTKGNSRVKIRVVPD